MSGSFDDSEDVGVGRQVRRSPAERWAINTPSAQREDRLPLEKATVKWARIYALFSASGERAQDEVFSAVNAYFLVNGCSPRGKYSRDVKTAGGLSVPIGEVVKVTGVLDGDIRQFLRARLKDSYECLKYSPSLQVDESFRDKAERKGVPRDMCYVMADWLSECEYFTADESRVAASLSTKNIAEANARYDASGKSHNTRVNEIVEVTTPEGLRNGVRHEESLHASY